MTEGKTIRISGCIECAHCHARNLEELDGSTTIGDSDYFGGRVEGVRERLSCMHPVNWNGKTGREAAGRPFTEWLESNPMQPAVPGWCPILVQGEKWLEEIK